MNEQSIANLQFAISYFGTRCRFELNPTDENEWSLWVYDRLSHSEDPIARVYGDREFDYYGYLGA